MSYQVDEAELAGAERAHKTAHGEWRRRKLLCMEFT